MVSTKWCLMHLPGSLFSGSACPLSAALLADWAMLSSGQQTNTNTKPDRGPMQMEDFMLSAPVTSIARRISSKSQPLLVIGYLLVVTSWLFTVPPYISLVFVINYSCSYCGSSRSADSKVKAFLEVTPCSTPPQTSRRTQPERVSGNMGLKL